MTYQNLTRRHVIQSIATVVAALPITGPGALAMGNHRQSISFTNHPAVGAWRAQYRGHQPPAYIVLHADGTGTFRTTGTAYFSTVADPSLSIDGIVVWEPVDEWTIDTVVHIVWGDATDETTMTIRQRWTFDEDGASASVLTRMTHTDAEGIVINRASNRFDAERLLAEPFDAATPGATPAA